MTEKKLPPGQSWRNDLVVYDINAVPPLDLKDYRLRLFGRLRNPCTLSWEELQGLPRVQVRADFHCVEGWSVPDLVWEGVPASAIVFLTRPEPDVVWVLVHGYDGYTTNVPFAYFARPDTLLAFSLNGAPLPPHHGWPLRLVVPSLYAWKSAKYLVALEFLSELRRGYWEEKGYHDVGDPWREERRWR
ncbi:MAG: molybdopterin-dependent oxidoreductase [Candidatus Bipolaricaulota bacterium]|nr:molybdopterin-dependent oxidoreductase [Candidatus Bipolaricaulota bacterium]MDW8126387.1 molybdopterin-dependent oxidoreductase [Candidatus Bipolaricaulota bacterium]